MIHTKKKNNTEELKNIQEERSKRAGNKWKFVPQHAIVEELINQAKEREWFPHDVQAQTSRKGKDIAIGMTVILPGFSDELKQGISVINSNDMTFRSALYGGVVINGNGVPLTKVLFRKHDDKFNLKEEVETALDEFSNRANGFNYTMNSLEDKELTYQEAARCLDVAGRRKLMPWSRAGRLLESIKPDQKISKWELLVRFSEMAKMNPPIKQMEQVHRFLYNVLQV
jgi:hypothetical protein